MFGEGAAECAPGGEAGQPERREVLVRRYAELRRAEVTLKMSGDDHHSVGEICESLESPRAARRENGHTGAISLSFAEIRQLPRTVSFWLIATCAAAMPKDVTLRRGETRLIGEVVDYKGKQLEIRVEGQVRTLPAEQVRRIDFRKHTLHAEGDKLFAAHDFAEARNRYLKARLAEPRAWVQRILMAQVVWCDRNLGQFDGAGERFLARWRRPC